VVGFDGIEAEPGRRPPLTTVEQPIEEIAETAINALRSLIDDPQKQLPDYSFRPQLNVPRVDGPAPARPSRPI
jgi:DNA-binding LacI/PurR family transcriptional regulator